MEKTYIKYQHFKDLIEMVWKLETLEKNWDYCGSLPIEKGALTKAVRLLYILKDNNLLRYDKYEPSYNIPSKETVKFIFDEIKKCEGTEDSWKLMRRLRPSVEYNWVKIKPTPIGGVEFSWCCHIALVYVKIFPERNSPLFYECGYIDENKNPSVYCRDEQGRTYNYEKIASKVKENISHCF